MTLKITFDDLEGQRSISQNDVNNEKANCAKFEASIFDSFENTQNDSSTKLVIE